MEQGGALQLAACGAHFLSLAAAMLLFGAALFPAYTGMQGWPPPCARSAPLVLASIGLAGFALAASLTLINLTGDAASLTSLAELEGFFLETSFGPVLLAGLILFALLFAAALGFAIPPDLPERHYRWRDALFLVLSAGVIVSFAATGHARSTANGKASLAVGSETFHILAAAAWIGGLPPLLLHLRRSKRHNPEKTFALPMLYGFSFMGQWAVAILIIGGVSTLAVLIAAWHIKLGNLPMTAYTFTLLIKLALLAVALAFAAVNRFVLIPALEEGTARIARLQQTVLAECLLGALIVAAAAVLSRLPPPM